MTTYGVAVSGGGTILEAMLLDGLRPKFVIADRPCRGIELAQSAGIDWEVIDRKLYGYMPGVCWDRKGFTKMAVAELRNRRVNFLAMAGFMTIWHPVIFEHFGGGVINTHPALLPKHKGAKAVADTLAAGDAVAGCTIHVATDVLDDERFILAQAEVPVLPGDDVETLHERIKVEERKLYPQVILDVLSGKINLDQIKEQS